MALLTPFSKRGKIPQYVPAPKQVEFLSNDLGVSILGVSHLKTSETPIKDSMPCMYRIDFMDGTTGIYGSSQAVEWIEHHCE